MILDGQQRITPLHYMFYEPPKEVVTPKYTSKRYFFLRLEELEKDNVEEAVFSVDEDDARKYLDKNYQFKHKIVPFIELSSKEKWRMWKEAFVECYIE